jgi:imidazoleglycerol phosphate synthase glutamine amidotransferase subunit HisH
MDLYLLDYGAGNVQSLANSLEKLGHKFTWITQPADFAKATVSHNLLIILERPHTSLIHQ